MTIDTERLKTDAAYWDEVAPEYASWAALDERGRFRCWQRYEIGNEPEFKITLVKRPTKPAAPEYPRMAIMVNPHEAPLHYGKEALGKEIEVIEWLPDESCYVVRFDWGLGVLHDSMVDFGLYDARTAEQRQREELVDLMESERENYFPKAVTAEEIADAILSRYNLEKKQ